MTFMTEGDQILKSDARGRVRVPVERQEALLDEFERSGLSGVKFAKLVGVKYPTFALWVQKRRRARAACTTEGARGAVATVRRPIRLFEAVTGEPAVGRSGVVLTVELPGGGRLLVEAPSQLRWAAELLRLLSQADGRPC
jgi:hypothetical protein